MYLTNGKTIQQTYLGTLFCCLLFSFFISCENSLGSSAKTNTPEISQEKNNPVSTRFEEEIRRFEQLDKTNGIKKGTILLVGSSSFRMWDSMEQDLAPHSILNRGFGGATTPELIHYANRIVLPYEPKLIVLYIGENDISEGQTAQQVYSSFKKLVAMINEQLPKTHIAFVSMKPSINRWHLWPQFQEGNQLIADYCANNTLLDYVDISTAMLTDNQQIDSTIFIADGLHMNASGYERWTKIIKQKLNTRYPQ